MRKKYNIGRTLIFIAPDLMALSGLGLLAYGLYLYSPRVSYTVIGGILFLVGAYSSASREF